MRYIVSIEGQSIELPEEVATSDDKVKQALSPYYPGAATAKITRAVKDDITTVTVIKQAGTKGCIFLDNLVELPEKENPVFMLYNQMKDINPTTLPKVQLLMLEAQINISRKEGSEQNASIEKALSRLQQSTPHASAGLILGF